MVFEPAAILQIFAEFYNQSIFEFRMIEFRKIIRPRCSEIETTHT